MSFTIIESLEYTKIYNEIAVTSEIGSDELEVTYEGVSIQNIASNTATLVYTKAINGNVSESTYTFNFTFGDGAAVSDLIVIGEAALKASKA